MMLTVLHTDTHTHAAPANGCTSPTKLERKRTTLHVVYCTLLDFILIGSVEADLQKSSPVDL